MACLTGPWRSWRCREKGPNPVPRHLSERHLGTTSLVAQTLLAVLPASRVRSPSQSYSNDSRPNFHPDLSSVLQYYQDTSFALPLSGYGSSMGLFSAVS